MKLPLFRQRFVDTPEFFVSLIGTAIRERAQILEIVGTLALDGLVAGQVHGDGCVAALGPELGPVAECGAASAVQKNDGRKAFALCSSHAKRFGRCVVGEDARRMTLV